MTDATMVTVLRTTRLTLNPEVQRHGIGMSRTDIMEVAWPDGTTHVVGRSVPATGPEGFEKVPVHWNLLCGGTFDAQVEHERTVEEALGALVGEPDVIVPAGSPVTQEGPEFGTLMPVCRCKD